MDDDELPIPEEESTNVELARLAREAIAAQAGEIDMQAARQRCQRVIDLYSAGQIVNGADYFHAAWVMLCGETQGHYHMARVLARQATEQGEERAWSLRAMAWDRWLVASGKPQRFGTQIIKQGGRWSLGPVDPDMSDLERAMYGVPPLYVQHQNAEQLQRREEG
ncbi:hypothetical protein [Candidatus Oscillochloris fontis]|uniref:hypothetical protein n=1 Tax=Candidatus Oscillochloris fontis TaxID=2496868 RepID=UPI00101DFAD7|nr:hypothetical protein [Candidatus Oscillochloris fontis]